MSAMENVAWWHERDISHSSVERVIAPDSTILLDFMLNRVTGLVKDLVVYPENMKRNMERSYGLVYSQRVLLKLAEKGISREDAYKIVQKNSMKVWKEGGSFMQALLQDKEVSRYLKPTDVKECFDIRPYIRNVDYIFKRVFGK